MPVNRDKPDRWKKDVDASVDQFNEWFMSFAPVTFRETRDSVTHVVHEAIVKLNDYRDFTAELIRKHPSVLSVLRMSTAPPIARDRLAGLAYTSRSIVGALEEGRIPRRDAQSDVDRIVAVIERLLDRDLFPWLSANREPTEQQRDRASTIIADRLCGATSDPLIRNAQEKRQLAAIELFLTSRGYQKKSHPSGQPLQNMQPGTFTLMFN